MLLSALILLSYLLGSIPFGVIVAKLFGIGNITKQGSGNIGATNVMRVGGKIPGLLTFFFDGLKGYAVVYIAQQMLPGHIGEQALAGLMAVVGHIFPVWLRFKGGKGVATTVAVILALNTILGVFAIVLWAVVFAITKTSSLASLIAIFSTTIVALTAFSSQNHYVSAVLVLLTILIFYRHIENIKRLIHGKEMKL